MNLMNSLSLERGYMGTLEGVVNNGLARGQLGASREFSLNIKRATWLMTLKSRLNTRRGFITFILHVHQDLFELDWLSVKMTFISVL